MASEMPQHFLRTPEQQQAAAVEDRRCECYGDPEGSPLCDECRAEERERDEERPADLFEEDVYLYDI